MQDLTELLSFVHSVFTFALLNPRRKLSLPPGAFIYVRAPGREHGGGDAIRPYTAISDPSVKGSFDMLIKRYDKWGTDPNDPKSQAQSSFMSKLGLTGAKGASPSGVCAIGALGHCVNPYRPPGAVSTYIHSLKVGDTLDFKFTRKCRSKLSLNLLLGIPQSNPSVRQTQSDGNSNGNAEDTASAKLADSELARQVLLDQEDNSRGRRVDAKSIAFVSNAADAKVAGMSPHAPTEITSAYLPTPPVLFPSRPSASPAKDIIESPLKRRNGNLISTSSAPPAPYACPQSHLAKPPLDGVQSFTSEDKYTSNSMSASAVTEQDPDLLVDSVTFIAVGVGVAPMIQLIRTALNGLMSGEVDEGIDEQEVSMPMLAERSQEDASNMPLHSHRDKDAKDGKDGDTSNTPPSGRSRSGSFSRFTNNIRCATQNNFASNKLMKVVLLYGVRDVDDILCRRQLLQFERDNPERFKVIFSIGSRYDNVHMGAKTKRLQEVSQIAGFVRHAPVTADSKQSVAAAIADRKQSKEDEYLAPSLPKGFEQLHPSNREIGWVNFELIQKYQALSPISDDTRQAANGIQASASKRTRVVVCGLPSVYEKLCGSRFSPDVPSDSVLGRLGYDHTNVIKL